MINVYGLENDLETEKIKMYLRHKKADFNVINMEENDVAKSYLLHNTYDACIPIVEFDKKFIHGFKSGKLDRAISLILGTAV